MLILNLSYTYVLNCIIKRRAVIGSTLYFQSIKIKIYVNYPIREQV